MSDFDKAIAALVAVEVNKQLGERNSLPNVKRPDVTADQWKDIIALEAWALIPKADGEVFTDEDGIEWDYILETTAIQVGHWQMSESTIRDAAFNVGAPAPFRKLRINLQTDARFVIGKESYTHKDSDNKSSYRKARCLIK